MDSNLLIRWRVILDYQSQGRGGCWPFLSLSSLRSVRTEPQAGFQSRLDKQRIMKEGARFSCPHLKLWVCLSWQAGTQVDSRAKLNVVGFSLLPRRGCRANNDPGLFSLSNVARSSVDASVAS